MQERIMHWNASILSAVAEHLTLGRGRAPAATCKSIGSKNRCYGDLTCPLLATGAGADATLSHAHAP